MSGQQNRENMFFSHSLLNHSPQMANQIVGSSAFLPNFIGNKETKIVTWS